MIGSAPTLLPPGFSTCTPSQFPHGASPQKSPRGPRRTGGKGANSLHLRPSCAHRPASRLQACSTSVGPHMCYFGIRNVRHSLYATNNRAHPSGPCHPPKCSAQIQISPHRHRGPEDVKAWNACALNPEQWPPGAVADTRLASQTDCSPSQQITCSAVPVPVSVAVWKHPLNRHVRVRLCMSMWSWTHSQRTPRLSRPPFAVQETSATGKDEESSCPVHWKSPPRRSHHRPRDLWCWSCGAIQSRASRDGGNVQAGSAALRLHWSGTFVTSWQACPA